MENCVAPGVDEFDVLLEVVLSLVRVQFSWPNKTQNGGGGKLRAASLLVCVSASCMIV